jgi:Flp pilus assembly protein TadG
MRWLTDEEGATAIIIGLLLIPLIGFGAIVIDVGLIYWETRQLQNGADAAALAIAQDCVDDDSAGCGPFQATADEFTDLNANDGHANADVLLPGLDGDNSVTVTATTRTTDGSNRLSYALAGVLGTDFNATFARSATARWGAAGSATTIPLTFSFCEWDVFTDGLGADALPTGTRVVYHHTNSASDVNDCDGPAGQDAPGGFGWLNEEGPCSAFVENGEVNADTGASISKDCKDLFPTLLGQTVLMPIFVEVTGTGTNAMYEIGGFAAFEFQGYRFPGVESSPKPCGAPLTCISGRFVNYYDLGEEPADGDIDFGAYIIGLSR